MARMNIVTYNLRNTFAPYFLTDNEGFNFSEFFRVDEAQMCFVHEADVRKFVNLLATAPLYPFADEAMDQSLCHTLWYVPGVNAAHCLAQILAEPTADNPFRNYKVVNVAGDSVSSQTSPLEEVRTAISTNERTITLSCGRLTTGVSVPEWTAVFMLAGSADTGCAHYFQTIFRCQSPYREGIKAECYTFDFSPTRTLTAIDQYISNNLASTEHEARVQKLTEFLHYCPTIVIDGGKRNRMDTDTFIRNINTSYSTSLIRNGTLTRCEASYACIFSCLRVRYVILLCRIFSRLVFCFLRLFLGRLYVVIPLTTFFKYCISHSFCHLIEETEVVFAEIVQVGEKSNV
jgi:hypothetical protein